jgi:predicted PurR-regulated permease PerM
VSFDTRRHRPEHWSATWYAFILRLVVLGVLGYVLWRVGAIIVMVLISAMLALTVAPVVDWLQRSRALAPIPRHYRRAVATTLVFILLFATLVGVTIGIVRPLVAQVAEFFTSWKDNQALWEQRWTAVQGWYAATFPLETRAWIEKQAQQWAAEKGGTDIGAELSKRLQQFGYLTVHSGKFLVELLLVPVLAFSFLTESRPLKREFTYLVPASQVRDALYLVRRTGAILQSYAIGQLILALIAGVVVWFLMTALGIRYAMALAVIAAVTRVIPVIGPLLGGIPIVLIATLQGWEQGLYVLIAFTLMHLIESKVIMPRIIGHRINLHPAVVIVVLLIGAEFFGMWGMFLAAPVAAVIKVTLQHFLVRPRRGGRPPGRTPKTPARREETEVGRPAIAGARSHSGAH